MPSTVQLLKLPDVGVPSTGVTSVGVFAKTSAPVPVSSLTAAAKLADDGVPSHVAMPEPNDVMPVPPLATAKVPETVTAPVVVVLGVNPVVPKLIDATVLDVVASVPDVGNVTFVDSVVVNVSA